MVPDTTSADTRCVAGQLFSTRGRLVKSCLTALKPISDSYEPKECGSNGKGIEYIAQARAIARLNQMQVFPSRSGINANLQWEVGLPNSKNPSSPLRADILIYDRNDSAVPVQIIEVKGTWNRDYDKTDIQIQGYIDALDPKIGNQYTVVAGLALNGLADSFRVHIGQCVGSNEAIYATYSSTTNEIPGMLVVEEISRTQCPSLVPPPLKRPDISDRDLRFDDKVTEPYPVLITPDEEGEPAPSPFDPATVLVAGQVSAQVLTASMQCRAQCEDFFKTLAVGSVEARQKINDFLNNGFRGRIWGDPHLVTLDGLSYDLQSVGEFDLITAPSWDFNVQVRFKPIGTKVSALSSLAFKLNEHTVEFNGNTLLVDHTPTTIPDGSYLYFDRGAALINKDGKFLAVWPGQTFRPMMLFGTGVSPTFSIPPGTATTGLLGNNNGSKTDEFALRDGTSLGASPSQGVIHGPFASSWRITDQTSDFTYAPGESTATYTDPTLPSNVVKVSDFTAAQIADASATCTQLGILRGPQFDACLYDMLVVGDVQFAAAAADPGDQVGVHSSGVDSNGKLTVGFDDTVPANFSNTFLSTDPATSIYAGPITDRSGYGFSIPDIPAHTNAKITFDLLAIGSWNGDATDQTVALKVDGNQVWQTKFPDTGNSVDPVLTGDGLGAPKLTGMLASGLPFAIFTASVTLNHQASQLRADLTTSGLSSTAMKVLGVDNISVEMQLVPPQTFDITLPASVSDGVPGPGAGNLETSVSSDQYRFTVPAGGQSVFLAMGQTCPTWFRWTLTNTTTGATPASGYCYQGNKELENLPAGSYVLEWTGTNNASGPYSFQLMPVTVDAFDVSLPVSVSNGVPGGGAGNLETVASHDQYRFMVPAGGQSVFLAMGQTCPTWLRWTLTNTTTGLVPATGYCYQGNKELENLPAGSYVLEWTGTNNASGPYSFQLMPVTVDAFDVSLPVSVSNGAPGAGAGNLETVASHDQYRFMVPAGGQSVFLAMGQTCPTWLRWTLTDTTTGLVPATGYCYQGSKQIDNLPAGAYLLEWTGTSNASGPYSFQLMPVTVDAFDVSLPVSVSNGAPGAGAGNLETVASHDQYRFSVPAGGQSVFLADQGCPTYLQWTLKNTASNITTATGLCWQGNRQIDNLPAGPYTLEWAGTNNASGPYSFQLMPVTVDAFDVSLPVSVSNGAPGAGAGNLETIGAHDQYRFTVPAGGQSVFLVDRGCPTYLQWTLKNATTGTTAGGGYCWQGNKELDNLSTGAYVLEWTGTNNASGPYAFQLMPVTVDAFDVTLPVSVSNGVPGAGAGNLETVASHDQYRFTVPAGGQSVFLVDQGCPTDLQWTLKNATTGTTAGGGYCWQGNKELDNLSAGAYVLEWTGTNNASGPYAFQLMPVTVDAFDVTLPVSVSNGVPGAGAGNLETAGAHDQYRFTVPAGGQSVFLAPGQTCPTYLQWTLKNTTTGTTAGSGYCWQGNKELDNLSAGAYVLEWTGTNNASGPYAFQLMPVTVDALDISLPVSVSNGVPGAGAGNLETVASHDQYRFTVPAGGQSALLAPGQTCPTYLQWTLKNTTTGTTAGSGYCWQGNKELDNLTAGAYVLEWTGTNNASGPYSFQLMPVTMDSFDVTLPVSVSNGVPGAGAGNLETVASHDQYRFTAPAGGQSALLHLKTCPTYLGWTLKNTTTGTTASSGYCYSGDKQLNNLPAGAYVLEWIGTNNNSGTYSFDLG